MEALSGNEITNEKLDHAIEVYNRNRFLLRRICELRRADRPVLLGSEYMDMMLADQVMDKAEMNVLLEQFLEELEARPAGRDTIRLMLIGSETWNSDLERLVESLGANVVIDELDNEKLFELVRNCRPLKQYMTDVFYFMTFTPSPLSVVEGCAPFDTWTGYRIEIPPVDISPAPPVR